MSILIKGMEMPTTCRDCHLSTFTDFDSMPFCNITMNDICLNDWETKRCDNCPLVPVPKHGRLIDADALMARFEKEEKAADEHGRNFSFSFKSAGENCAEWWSVQQMLFDAPTIIEAEEGE